MFRLQKDRNGNRRSSRCRRYCRDSFPQPPLLLMPMLLAEIGRQKITKTTR